MSDDPVIRISVSPRAEPVTAEPPKRKPQALGRGLGALMGEMRREEPLVSASAAAVGSSNGSEQVPTSGLALLPVSSIEPHPQQPRRRFEEGALDELAASIASRGVIQPVIVRPLGAGRYQLVAGERRWRAAQPSLRSRSGRAFP